jgi:hypothetical protein
MKHISIILFFLAFSFAGFSQGKVKLYLDHKLVGQRSMPSGEDTPATINVHLKSYNGFRKVKRAVVELTQLQSNRGPFKFALEGANANEETLFTVEEMAGKHGQFLLNPSTLRKAVQQNKDIKVYLTEDPANSRMGVRSSRRLLVSFHFD